VLNQKHAAACATRCAAGGVVPEEPSASCAASDPSRSAPAALMQDRRRTGHRRVRRARSAHRHPARPRGAANALGPGCFRVVGEGFGERAHKPGCAPCCLRGQGQHFCRGLDRQPARRAGQQTEPPTRTRNRLERAMLGRGLPAAHRLVASRAPSRRRHRLRPGIATSACGHRDGHLLADGDAHAFLPDLGGSPNRHAARVGLARTKEFI